MVIIHYFLGFPPYRTGGLTRYAIDLMEEQVDSKDSVIGIWPGKMSFFSKKTIFKEHRSINGIRSIEMINPLPVPLDEGVVSTSEYMKKTDVKVFKNLFYILRPDVIHIHTLMGLYSEFIEAANLLGIKTVFTTHDYYGVCPRVTLFRDGMPCTNNDDCHYCVECNQFGLSINKIRVIQSPVYRVFKDFAIVKCLRKKHREKRMTSFPHSRTSNQLIQESALNYSKLRNYYKSILEAIDVIHFNSSISKRVYERYISPKSSCVLSITHKYIDNHYNERNKGWDGTLHLLYLGPTKEYKGYNILKEALERLDKEKLFDFELNIYYPTTDNLEYIKIHNAYSQQELSTIFEKNDVLIAPSVWYETFGFTVLEALSYGVPVIVSNHVGAKDIVGTSGIVVEAGSVDALKDAIIDVYNRLNDTFSPKSFIIQGVKTIKKHKNEIEKLYLE